MAVENPEKLRSFLKGEQARLQEIVAEMDAEGTENLGYGNHMADDASDAFEQAKELALRQNAEMLLSQVNDALERLDEGLYGICRRCGQEIDPARLRALPYATYCLRCQQLLEG
jgi:DnaK suppressor protein